MALQQSKIFFDTNILIESALKRRRKPAVDKLLHASAGRAYISSLTAHLLVYFARKDVALSDIRLLLDDFIILPLSATEVTWAFDNIRDNDFEDALQLACAVQGECDTFVTLDTGLAKRYATLPHFTIQLL